MPTTTDALLAVDVQNDFCPGGALGVADGDAVVAPINALLAVHRLRVLTQDWHPRDHRSFASNHPGAAPFSTTSMPYGEQVLWPAHCVQETHGAAFHRDLRVDCADLVLRKGIHTEIDSYSAFVENDRSTSTGLERYLRGRGVASITIVGLATDFCVAWSALDAIRCGFEVVVDLAACRGIDLDGSLERAIAEMRSAGVRVVGGG